MLLLRAVTDDSAASTGDKRLFLAGYLAFAETWEKFSSAWARVLRQEPRIAYLKMAEAQNLRGEFRGWTIVEKNKKLRQLANVIRRHNPSSYEFSVSRVAFDTIYRPVAPYGLGKPHFVCLFGIVSAVTRALVEAASEFPELRVEFTFDQQDGTSEDFGTFFEYMSENFPETQKKLIKKEPLFLDDKEYLPLQAADMLVWHLRREHEDGLSLLQNKMTTMLRGQLHYGMQLEPTMLARWAREFRSIPIGTSAQTKSGWKGLMRETKALAESGFKPPHGSLEEIFRAHLEHMKKLTER